MWRRALLVFATVLAASSLCADDRFVLTTIPESPTANQRVFLQIDEYTRAETYQKPIVERSGAAVIVHQYELINSIAVIEGHGRPHWSTRTIDLGRLPAGDYLILLDQVIDDFPDRSQTFEFVVLHVGDRAPSTSPREHR